MAPASQKQNHLNTIIKHWGNRAPWLPETLFPTEPHRHREPNPNEWTRALLCQLAILATKTPNKLGLAVTYLQASVEHRLSDSDNWPLNEIEGILPRDVRWIHRFLDDKADVHRVLETTRDNDHLQAKERRSRLEEEARSRLSLDPTIERGQKDLSEVPGVTAVEEMRAVQSKLEKPSMSQSEVEIQGHVNSSQRQATQKKKSIRTSEIERLMEHAERLLQIDERKDAQTGIMQKVFYKGVPNDFPRHAYNKVFGQDSLDSDSSSDEHQVEITVRGKKTLRKNQSRDRQALDAKDHTSRSIVKPGNTRSDQGRDRSIESKKEHGEAAQANQSSTNSVLSQLGAKPVFERPILDVSIDSDKVGTDLLTVPQLPVGNSAEGFVDQEENRFIQKNLLHSLRHSPTEDMHRTLLTTWPQKHSQIYPKELSLPHSSEAHYDVAIEPSTENPLPEDQSQSVAATSTGASTQALDRNRRSLPIRTVDEYSSSPEDVALTETKVRPAGHETPQDHNGTGKDINFVPAKRPHSPEKLVPQKPRGYESPNARCAKRERLTREPLAPERSTSKQYDFSKHNVTDVEGVFQKAVSTVPNMIPTKSKPTHNERTHPPTTKPATPQLLAQLVPTAPNLAHASPVPVLVSTISPNPATAPTTPSPSKPEKTFLSSSGIPITISTVLAHICTNWSLSTPTTILPPTLRPRICNGPRNSSASRARIGEQRALLSPEQWSSLLKQELFKLSEVTRGRWSYAISAIEKMVSERHESVREEDERVRDVAEVMWGDVRKAVEWVLEEGGLTMEERLSRL